MTIDAAFARFPTLTTRRLVLRAIQLEDATTLFAAFSDVEVMRFYGHAIHQTLEETQELLARFQANYAHRAAIHWGITLASEATVIGTCSMHHIDTGSCRAETGYELQRTYWRQGFMREAMTAILTYGFTEMELHRIEAIIDIANAASKNLLLRLGFRYEGNLRQRYRFHGRFEDEHYFGLLRDEWHETGLTSP